MTELSVDRLPRGARGWRAFVDNLTKVDDTAESFWLEMKSELDLSRTGAAKIAKFILGAANRQPDAASRALEGYAVMVVGVGAGAAQGVAPVEDVELERRLSPFLGVPGPAWETVRVRMPNNLDVLIIVVDPPKPGDPIHVCRKDGEGVADGDVYVRARGETRRAKSAEIDQLRARERARVPDVQLEVSVVGPVCAYTCDPDVLDEYIDSVRGRLLAALPRSRPPSDPAAAAFRSTGLASLLDSVSQPAGFARLPDALVEPEDRTEEAYRQQVEAWTSRCRQSLPGLVDGLISRTVDATVFTVRNLTDRYLSAVQMQLHLPGPIEQLKSNLRRTFNPRLFLPHPPRPWGPRPRDFGYLEVQPPQRYVGLPNLSPRGGPTSKFRNGGSVDATFELPELRPRAAMEFADEVVLVLRDQEVSVIEGTWSATAQDIDAVFEGHCTVQVDAPVDVTGRLKSAVVDVD